MAPKEYSFSLLDPLSTLSLLEEISSLLCTDRPEFGPLFGEDHRRRVEEDVTNIVRKEKKMEVESKEEEREGLGKEERGLLTVVTCWAACTRQRGATTLMMRGSG